MLMATITSTYALIGLYRYKEVPQSIKGFALFWQANCKREWKLTILFFAAGILARDLLKVPYFALNSYPCLGMAIFMLLMAVIIWIHTQYFLDEENHRRISSSICSFICCTFLLYLSFTLWTKWGPYLLSR